MKKQILFFALVIFSFFVNTCKKEEINEKIVGKWILKEFNYSLEQKSDSYTYFKKINYYNGIMYIEQNLSSDSHLYKDSLNINSDGSFIQKTSDMINYYTYEGDWFIINSSKSISIVFNEKLYIIKELNDKNLVMERNSYYKDSIFTITHTEQLIYSK